MHSTQLSPAQFMMSYLESEQGKLSRKITDSDSSFSRALEAEQSKAAGKASANPQSMREAAPNGASPAGGTTSGTVGGTAGFGGAREADGEIKSFGNRGTRKSASPKAKQKVKDDLTFANPVVIERIFAQMQVPAEVRQACMNASDSEGRVPLKAVSSVLSQKVGPGTVPGQPGAARPPLVAAQDVRSLISSLQQRQPGLVRSLPQLDLKQGGSYSIEEFREILDHITQQIANAEAVKGEVVVASTLQKPRVTPEPGETMAPQAGIAPDQLERLTASVIPSFSMEDADKGMDEKGRAENAGNLGGQAAAPSRRAGAGEAPPVESKPAEAAMSPEETAFVPPKASGTVQARRHDDRKGSEDEAQEKPAAGTAHVSEGSRAAARNQAPQVPLTGPERVELADHRSLQVESSGRESAVGKVDAQSVNLASSLASIVEGKATVRHYSGNENISGGSSEEISSPDGVNPREDRVPAPVGPDEAGRRNSREMAGQGSNLSFHENSSGYTVTELTAGKELFGAQSNDPGTGAVDSRKIEGLPADTAADNILSDPEAGEDGGTELETDQNSFARGDGGPENRGSAFSDRDSTGDGSRSDRFSSSTVQVPRGTAASSHMASSADTRSPESPISFQHSSWPEALSHRLQRLHQEGRSQMTLDVEPEHLGRLSLRIETNHNNVTAYISTESEQTRALLMQNASSLRQHLEDQGLQLGQFFVEVRKDGSNGRSRHQPQGSMKSGSASPRAAGESSGAAGGSMTATYGRTAGGQTISLFA